MKKNSLHFFNWYFLFSIFYYCFGRYKWNIPSYPKLIIFLITCYFFLNIGYRLTWKNKSTLMYGIRREYEFKLVPYKFIRTLFFISSLALIIFQVVWVIVFFDHFSIMNIFSMLGDNYYSRLDTTFDSKIPIMQFRTLLWGITLFSYPIGFLYFKIMPRKDKILFLITIMVDVFAALNMGISKNIGDIVIIFLGMMLLKNTVSTSRKSKRQNKKNIIIIATIMVIGLGTTYLSDKGIVIGIPVTQDVTITGLSLAAIVGIVLNVLLNNSNTDSKEDEEAVKVRTTTA